jgi:hypothetical protein
LFTRLFIAEATESDGFFPGFRHEPSGLGCWFGILTPGTLNHVFGKKVELTQADPNIALPGR